MKRFVEIPEVWATEFLESDVLCDGYWISSLTQSWQKGYADNCTLAWSNYVDLARRLRFHTDKPIYVDVDMLFNEPNIGAIIAKELEAVGCSGIVIESKRFPKVNSLIPNQMVLSTPDEFCRLINKVKMSVKNLDVVARIEYLATTYDVELTYDIAMRAVTAGADKIVIHWGKDADTSLLKRLLEKLKQSGVSTGIIPTTFMNQIIDGEFELLADFSILGNLCSSYIRQMFSQTDVNAMMRMPGMFQPILERSEAMAPAGQNLLVVLGAKPDRSGKYLLEDEVILDRLKKLKESYFKIVLVVDEQVKVPNSEGVFEIVTIRNSIGETASVAAARAFLNTEYTTLIYADVDWSKIQLDNKLGMEFYMDVFLGVLKEKTDKVILAIESIDPTLTLLELGSKCNSKIITV